MKNSAKLGSKVIPTLGLLAGYGLSKYYFSLRRQINFKGKVVLITGGSRGLGLILAREIGKEGGLIAICARDQNELIQARNWLAREGASTVMPYICDVSNRQQVEDMMVAVNNHFGTIDILINNAGTIHVAPLEHTTIRDFEESMNVIFWGTLYPTLAVLDQMREKSSGQIVNITSIGGMIGIPHLLPYSAAKSAVVGLSQALHAELKRCGITVTTIVPGLMRTGSYINASLKGQKEKEFAWFALSDTLPGISMDALRAAKQIMQAIRRRKALQIIGFPAKIAAFLNGNFPGVMAEVLSTIHDILPMAVESRTLSYIPAQGKDIDTLQKYASLKVLSRLGRNAVMRYQRYQS